MSHLQQQPQSEQHTQSLLQILSEENTSFSAMIELLVEERTALETQDIDEVNRLSQNKQKLTTKLESCAANRLKLMSLLNIKTPQSASSQLSEGLAVIWQQILDKAAECKKCNLINGQIIQISRNSLQRSMRLLKSESGDHGLTYGSHGQALTQRRSLEAIRA